jgi:hypothetical protein
MENYQKIKKESFSSFSFVQAFFIAVLLFYFSKRRKKNTPTKQSLTVGKRRRRFPAKLSILEITVSIAENFAQHLNTRKFLILLVGV